MKVRSKTGYRCNFAAFSLLLLGLAAGGTAQTAKPVVGFPSHLPYSFGNFVWWSDDELRAMLRKRIPGLGDEISTSPEAKGKMRDALKEILKDKGIAAEIYSEEPSYFGSARDPEAPVPSIRFSIIHPQILLNKVSLKVDPDSLAPLLQPENHWGEGRPYSAFGNWSIRSRIKGVLRENGYLDGQVLVARQPVFKEGEHFQVGIEVTVTAGPQYHVSSITADGGPLLTGRDFSTLYGMKEGDIPGRYPLSGLESQLRAFYLHYGYADVEIRNLPVLDRDHALISYHMDVIPVPVYHLRSLTINNLDATQESKARELLGMKPGDIYIDEAVNGLYHKLPAEPLLASSGFTFRPTKDKVAAVVNLSLDFYTASDKENVTIR